MPPRSRSCSSKNTSAGAAAAAEVRGKKWATTPPLPPQATPVHLSAEELRDTPDSRLLSYLMRVYEAVRGLSLEEPSQESLARETPFSAAYIQELLTPRLLLSPIPDVSQLVGCLLCDAVRLHHEQHHNASKLSYTGSERRHMPLSTPSDRPLNALGAVRAESLPFSPERCVDVLRCICACFAGLQGTITTTSPLSTVRQRQPLRRLAYLIERAATAHVFCHLLPHCNPTSEETQQALRSVFQAVGCASPAMTGELSSGTHAGRSEAAASTATCEEMVEVLRDILCTTNIVTPAQLMPLLEELIGASPTLQLMSPSASSLPSTSPTASKTRPRQRQAENSCEDGGAFITTRLLLEGMDILQPAIATWAMSNFEDGLAEVLASDALPSEHENGDGMEEGCNVTDTDEDEMRHGQQQRPHQHPPGKAATAPYDAQLSGKHHGLKAIAHVLQVLVALVELHVDLAEQLLPALAPHLEHTCPEVRLLLLRGISAAFSVNEAALRTYKATLMGPLLSRLFDIRPNIRLDSIRSFTMLLRRIADRAGGTAGDRSRTQELLLDLWQSLQPFWERLLTDPHVLVRRQAVISVTEAALAAPLLLQPAPHGDNIGAWPPREEQPSASSTACSPSYFLAHTLGLRALDKNRRVRCAAVMGLTQLYKEYGLAWIPNSLLDAACIDTGSSMSSTAPVALTPEMVIEGLLPVSLCCFSTAAATGSTQATLARWLSATPSGSSLVPQTPALFDFEKSAVEQTALCGQQHPQDGGDFDEGDALLGFGASTSSTRSLDGRGGPSSAQAPRDASTGVSTYVNALVRLCQDVDSVHFERLRRIFEKKPSLRLAIRRLFEFHAAMKKAHGDVKSAEGQHRIHSIHRLLNFLQETTGASKGEWDALFRTRDDAVRRTLLHACDASHTNWVEVREGLLRSLHGRVSTREFIFVQQTLVPQMMFPVQRAHLGELMQLLRRSIYTSAHGEVVVNEASAAGALRALLLLTAASPSLGVMGTEGLADALQAAAKQPVGPPPSWCALLLQALQQWATITSTIALTDAPHTGGSIVPEQDTLINTLRAMALASLPMQQTISCSPVRAGSAPENGSRSSGEALSALKHLAKQATRTLVALLRVPGYSTSAASALESLAVELLQRLAMGRPLTNDVKTVAWLASLKALARCASGTSKDDSVARVCASLLLSLPPPKVGSSAVKSTGQTGDSFPPILLALSSLLVTAVEDASDSAERASPKTLGTVSAVATDRTHVATTQPNGASSVSPLCANMSIAAAIVDGCAKAVVALALGASNTPNASATRVNICSRSDAVTCAADALLQGYKAVAALTPGRRAPASIGNCQRRISIEGQLVKLVLAPTPDIRRELAVSVILSVEENMHVRHAVQGKLAGHLLRRTCDMRVAAFLLLTAMCEDSKLSYHRLRGLIEAVGDHLRQKQSSQGVSLSSPSALHCYLEYTVPFLVLFLAHHPCYTIEKEESHFVRFQRVWHLLIGELLRHGTQCAGFVVELLSKIKQSDDALDPASDACRVMCDLASRVLLECLGQRQSRAEDLRRYPGAVLLPSFFVRTSRANPQKLLETVFLDDGVRVAANAPFRVPNLSEGAAEVASRGGSRQALSRASSTGRSAGDENAVSVTVTQYVPPYGVSHSDVADPASSLRKRERSLSSSVSAAVSLSPSVGPQGDETEENTCNRPQRERTEPAIGESCRNSDPVSSSTSAPNDFSAKQVAQQRLTIDKALEELFHGLTKADIAQLRWKVVRSRLEEALCAMYDGPLPQQKQLLIAKDGTGVDSKKSKGTLPSGISLEDLLQYAKDQLRMWYERAPA